MSWGQKRYTSEPRPGVFEGVQLALALVGSF